jgi:hypothetical protein
MTATKPKLSQLSASSRVNCDNFEGVPATRPKLLQLFPATGRFCNEFEGVVVR